MTSNEISDNEEIYKICPSSRAICRSIVVDIERLNLHSILKNEKREESSKEYAKNRVKFSRVPFVHSKLLQGEMGENEDSTRCRVYKSCNIEEKCHEWWLHFPRIKYPWHGVKPTTRHRDNSDYLQFPSRSLDTALSGKSQTTPSFHFLNSRPIRRYTSFPPAGKETPFPSQNRDTHSETA